MNNHSVNIAISGLGLSTTEDIKIKFRQYLPNEIRINWTNISDQHLDCLLINEAFFENNNIQRIIQIKNIPYLKISKQIEHQHLEHYLFLPLNDLSPLKKLIDLHFSFSLAANHSAEDITAPRVQPPKEIGFFHDLYTQDSRKLHLQDQFGTLAILDHYAHVVWLDPTRLHTNTDASISYSPASTSDFVKVSRKLQLNLENWLFLLIWSSPQMLKLPEANQHFRIHYWPQPDEKNKKVLLQLSASFSLGAAIDVVAQRLNIPVQQVQLFIAANQAIGNAELISHKDCKFTVSESISTGAEEQSLIKNIFSKIKRRFGF